MNTTVNFSKFGEKITKCALNIIGAVALILLLPVSNTFAETTVVAKVGDKIITERDLAFAETDLQKQFAKVPANLRKAAILNALIDIEVLAKAAEEAGLANDESFIARVNFLRSRALHNAFFQKNAAEKVTYEEIKAR